jgi:hypothetical protein
MGRILVRGETLRFDENARNLRMSGPREQID